MIKKVCKGKVFKQVFKYITVCVTESFNKSDLFNIISYLSNSDSRAVKLGCNNLITKLR